jgi:2',3'-cyclic-nucleotide 2'-phosphodiesterase (5'-nucleotidase family)
VRDSLQWAADSSLGGKSFEFLAANLNNSAAGFPGLRGWKIFDVAGVKVGVIGIVNPEGESQEKEKEKQCLTFSPSAPTLVSTGNFGTALPTEPVAAAQKARLEALAAGAQFLIVLTHQGMEDNLA